MIFEICSFQSYFCYFSASLWKKKVPIFSSEKLIVFFAFEVISSYFDIATTIFNNFDISLTISNFSGSLLACFFDCLLNVTSKISRISDHSALIENATGHIELFREEIVI